jgi:TetR/AcrR family transcriptional repressor of mexJK operon
MTSVVDVVETGERQVRGQALRGRILDAARETFLAVAASAGTTKATVYKHFGNKEALFIAVVETELDHALDEPMLLVSSHLARSTHVREDLVAACRAWVDGLAAPDMIKLRNLVAGELRRFPELGRAWRERGPERFHPVIADALRHLVEQRHLSIIDVDLAVLQLSGLVISAHLVYGAYGEPVDGVTREQLISGGVDMFIDHYRFRANS